MNGDNPSFIGGTVVIAQLREDLQDHPDCPGYGVWYRVG